jgi:hypothetical protein
MARLERMPEFLAAATRPDGLYENLGDTNDRKAVSIKGTPAQFAATGGQRGPKPARTVSFFDRGYLFGRTGWGETRPFADEAFFSLQYGTGMAFHGHDDGGAVTLYALGDQLLLDSGFKDYELDPWRTYLRSRRAHNTVVTGDLTSKAGRKTVLERRATTGRMVEAVVRPTVYPDVTMRRRVIFSRRLGYLVVEDTITSTKSRSWRQLWHLREGSRPTTDDLRTWTRSDGANVLIQQLVQKGSTRTIKGTTSPIQGWIARTWGTMIKAPVIERRQTGASVRFVTVLAPFRDTKPTVTDVELRSGGFSFEVTMDGVTERVDATASGASITDAP